MSRWFSVSVCPPGTYDWVAKRGSLEKFDELFVLREKWGEPGFTSFTGVKRLYEKLRGLPESPYYRYDLWFDTSDDPYKLALIGGNLLIHATASEKEDPPLRGTTAEETQQAIQTMNEIAALDWPVLKEEYHASTIRSYQRLYSRLEPGDELFFSLV